MFEFISKLAECVGELVQTLTPINSTSNSRDIDDDYVSIQINRPQLNNTPAVQRPEQTVAETNPELVVDNKSYDIDSFTDDCIIEQDNGVICDACHVITRGDDRFIKMMNHVKSTHHQIMINYRE